MTFSQNQLIAMATSLTNQKTRYRSIICTYSAFLWWKDCKNRSSLFWDIWL